MKEFVGIFIGTAIFYIVCDGLGQKNMGRLILICGTLSFLMFINPYIKKAESKAEEMRKDVQEFTNAIKGAGQSIDKISKPLGDVGKSLGKVDKGMQEVKKGQEQLKEIEDATKIPGVDSVDKAIEEWFKKLISGEKKGE